MPTRQRKFSKSRSGFQVIGWIPRYSTSTHFRQAMFAKMQHLAGARPAGATKYTQTVNDFGKLKLVQSILPQESLPLGLLLSVLSEFVAQAERDAFRQRRPAALEGGMDRPAKKLAVEVGVARQDPEIEVILHAAVGDAERHQCSSLSATTV